MMINPGFRVKSDIPRPDADLVAALGMLPTANIGDTMNRMACMHSRIVPMNAARLAGCALTVRVRAGDNLMLHKAIDMAGPGDVVVVDAQNERSYAVTGELMILWLRRRGAAGIIVDGCVRDAEALSALDFPVYASGVTPNGPLKEGGGEIGFPVMCGGLVVNPGDILVGDADGIVVVSQADAPTVLDRARIQNDREAGILREIDTLTWDRSWVDAALRAKGCEFVE